MQQLLRTDATNPDFIKLVAMLDADLKIRDGEDHAFYAQFNATVNLKQALVFYKDDVAIACGAFRPFTDKTVEVKRMFVHPDYRRQGFAEQVLGELEKWAGELHNDTCVLETGKNQPEAIRLYEKSGYSRIPNYGQYQHVENSICFRKNIVAS